MNGECALHRYQRDKPVGSFAYFFTVFSPKPGNSATFVSGNSASVLIDYANSPAGEAAYADAMAKDKCAIFGKKSAELESLNPRGSGETTRATYSCK